MNKNFQPITFFIYSSISSHSDESDETMFIWTGNMIMLWSTLDNDSKKHRCSIKYINNLVLFSFSLNDNVHQRTSSMSNHDLSTKKKKKNMMMMYCTTNSTNDLDNMDGMKKKKKTMSSKKQSHSDSSSEKKQRKFWQIEG